MQSFTAHTEDMNGRCWLIRDIRASDIAKLRAVLGDIRVAAPLFRGDHAAQADYFLPRFRRGKDVAIWAVAADNEAGCPFGAARCRFGKIDYFVSPEWWGVGAATALVRGLLENVFSRGIRQVVAQCSPFNARSCRLLTGLGFTRHPHVGELIEFTLTDATWSMVLARR